MTTSYSIDILRESSVRLTSSYVCGETFAKCLGKPFSDFLSLDGPKPSGNSEEVLYAQGSTERRSLPGKEETDVLTRRITKGLLNNYCISLPLFHISPYRATLEVHWWSATRRKICGFWVVSHHSIAGAVMRSRQLMAILE